MMPTFIQMPCNHVTFWQWQHVRYHLRSMYMHNKYASIVLTCQHLQALREILRVGITPSQLRHHNACTKSSTFSILHILAWTACKLGDLQITIVQQLLQAEQEIVIRQQFSQNKNTSKLRLTLGSYDIQKAALWMDMHTCACAKTCTNYGMIKSFIESKPMTMRWATHPERRTWLQSSRAFAHCFRLSQHAARLEWYTAIWPLFDDASCQSTSSPTQSGHDTICNRSAKSIQYFNPCSVSAKCWLHMRGSTIPQVGDWCWRHIPSKDTMVPLIL